MAWGLRLARSKGTAPQEPPKTEPPKTEPPAEATQRPPARPPAAPAPRPAGSNVNTLRQKLLDLYGQRVSRDDFARQAADLIVNGIGCSAAAFLSYEKRRERLFLVGQVGLGEAAAQTLSGVDGPGWDIPLRGLQTRRISVIESAHQNPFVPRPLVELSPRRLTIATLPFFHGYAPSGVLVLFANKPRGFTDSQLQAVGQALKVCALAFAELPRAPLTHTGGGAPAAPAPSSDGAPVVSGVSDQRRAADAQELARLRTAFDESLWQHAKELAETRRTAAEALEAERARNAEVQSVLASLEQERDRLATDLSKARGELATLADTRTAVEQRTQETRRLQEALDTVTAEATRTSEQLAALRQTHAELVVEHERAAQQQAEQGEKDANARRQDAETIATLRERVAALESEHDSLRRVTAELRATHEQAAAQLATVTAEAAGLRDQLADRTTAHDVLQAQHAELRASYEALMQSAAAAEGASTDLQRQLDEQTAALAGERDELRQKLTGALGRADELTQALAAAHEERDGSAAAAKQSAKRLSQVEETLAELQAEHAAAVGDLQRERDRLAAELRLWGEREPSWAAQLAEISSRAEAAEAERTRLTKSLEQAKDGARQQKEALEQTIEGINGQLADLHERYRSIEAAHAALQSDRDQLDALCGALRTEQEKASAEHDQAVATRERQIEDLQAQLADAVARFEQDNGERSSHTKKLAKERDALTAARRELEQALAERSERVQRLEAELAEAVALQNGVRGDLADAGARHQQEVGELRRQVAEAQRAIEELHRNRAEVVGERAAASEAAERLERDVAQLRAELAAAGESLAQHRAASEAAEAAEAERRTETEAAQREIAAGQQQIAERNRELAALQAQLDELSATVDQDRAAHRDELERLVGEWNGERSALEARAEELQRELEREQQEHRALAEALAADESQPALEIERHAIPGADDVADEVDGDGDEASLDDSLVIEAIERTEDEAAANTIAVVDGELGAPMLEALGSAGWETIACEPTAEAVAGLKPETLSGIALNVMAGEHGWQRVRELRQREELRAVPLLLYGKPSEGKGFCFGPTDCVLWPSAPQNLLDALARLAPRAKRVLAMSTDIDVVAGVREQLTGAGLSAAVMLDGKQALDLLPSVRPDAAVLHVSPSCVDIFRTIAGLRAHSEGLPVILLIDEEPSSRDASFLSGGTKILANKGTFSAAGVADEMSRLLGV